MFGLKNIPLIGPGVDRLIGRIGDRIFPPQFTDAERTRLTLTNEAKMREIDGGLQLLKEKREGVADAGYRKAIIWMLTYVWAWNIVVVQTVEMIQWDASIYLWNWEVFPLKWVAPLFTWVKPYVLPEYMLAGLPVIFWYIFGFRSIKEIAELISRLSLIKKFVDGAKELGLTPTSDEPKTGGEMRSRDYSCYNCKNTFKAVSEGEDAPCPSCGEWCSVDNKVK